MDGLIGRKCLTTLAVVATAILECAASPNIGGWVSPFQAGKPDVSRDKLIPLTNKRCVRDSLNKCTFAARVDFDHDGDPDVVRMVEGRNISALAVYFAKSSNKRPLIIASFKGKWNGSCYISAGSDQHSVDFTCPEASSATFAMHGGKPSVQWTGD